MRGANTSVLVLSGLAALTKAREVKVDEVPVECATICGPIVELTYKCDIDGSFDELKRRKLDGPPANPPPPEKRQAGKHGSGVGRHGVARRHHRRPPQDGDGGGDESTSARRQRAAPTAADAQQAGETTPYSEHAHTHSSSACDHVVTATVEHIDVLDEHFDEYIHKVHSYELFDNENAHEDDHLHDELHDEPHDIKNTNKCPPAIFATSTTSGTPAFPASISHLDRLPDDAAAGGNRTDTGSATGTVYSGSIRSATGNTTTSTAAIQLPTPPQQSPPQSPSSDPVPQPVVGGDPKKQPSQDEIRENAERDCTCTNKSFDVQLLAGLCQSCIRKSGNRADSLDIIMIQCNFTGADYTPKKDRLVDGIRVEAQKPFLSSSGNVLAGTGKFKPGIAAAAAALVSLVAGMALFV
ncbi:uncharacterized protein LY79DRAFT_670042 [Colletotrichum navitas]|uniref:Uncharacterized protein n=1 Tax=Colletotrichum navitas TaxID=681940 RepID=A0AAD8PZC4_9PEZI|nr:uncharacterized protein LY79DRAFT_670042 [Colletotrichum navitas]KAK1590350.1 hypothetical protein LY79DRAFT_670042 [Colletotrichum navitas]